MNKNSVTSINNIFQIYYYFSAQQPVVQQMKIVMEELKSEFKESDTKLEGKIDSLIKLQEDRLQLEKQRLKFDRERLQFEHEKAGLPRLPDE